MSPKDMSTVYKNMASLTFDGFIRDLYTSFGMSKEGVRLMWQANGFQAGHGTSEPNSRQVHLGQGIHRQQLHPGDQLEDITTKYLDQIEQRLLWKAMADVSMTEPTGKGQVVDLWHWCAAILGNAAMQALFGNVLLEIEPRLLDYSYTFDSESWKLTFQLAPLLARRMHSAKDKSREAFIRYFRLPAEKRPGTCYYLRTVEAKQRQAGINNRDIGIAAQMFFWGLVPSPFPKRAHC